MIDIKHFLFLCLSVGFTYSAPPVDWGRLEKKYQPIRANFYNAYAIATKTYDLEIVLEHTLPEDQENIKADYSRESVLAVLQEQCDGLERDYKSLQMIRQCALCRAQCPTLSQTKRGAIPTKEQRDSISDFEGYLDWLSKADEFDGFFHAVGVSWIHSCPKKHNK